MNFSNIAADTLSNVAPSISTEITNSPFSTNAIIGCVISALIGVVLGSIYSLFFQEKIQKFLSKIIPSMFRRRKLLSGKWNQNWHVISDSFPKENNSEIYLKERYNRVSGYFTVKDNYGVNYSYYMNGKIIDNQYIEGEWFDKYDGNTYHGTFLLSINVNMNKLEGNWVGTAKHHLVKADKWIWNRLS